MEKDKIHFVSKGYNANRSYFGLFSEGNHLTPYGCKTFMYHEKTFSHYILDLKRSFNAIKTFGVRNTLNVWDIIYFGELAHFQYLPLTRLATAIITQNLALSQRQILFGISKPTHDYKIEEHFPYYTAEEKENKRRCSDGSLKCWVGNT